MALTKQTVVDKIEVTEDGALQVRQATYILEDGVRIAGPEYHRAAYMPGADVSSETETVQAVADMVWFPEIRQALAAYRAATTEQKNVFRTAFGLPPLD